MGTATYYMYFPINGVVALVDMMASSWQSEVGVVGWDGFLEITTIMEGESTSSAILVK